jgi:hypothetical protein
MRTLQLAALTVGGALVLSLPGLGCTRQSSRGPVQWTASDPASPAGQSAAQAWSRSTSNDKYVRASKKGPMGNELVGVQNVEATPIPPSRGPAEIVLTPEGAVREGAPGVANPQPPGPSTP